MRSASRKAAVAVVLLVLLLSSVSVALAFGGEIQVVSSERDVRFPGGVVFDLEVEGETNIIEVKLYLKVSSGGIWSYTYPELTPSRRVETSFNLKVDGNRYLPPGTELEYYYSVRDAQGNSLDTRPETFVYIDDRFRWQTTDIGPVILFWHDLSDKRVERVAREVETSLDEIGGILQVELDNRVRGIIYNTRGEAGGAFPNLSRTTTEDRVFQGFAFPERGVFIGIGLEAGLIVHESAHLLLDAVTDSPQAKVPAWVDEGFASSVEPGGHGYGGGFGRVNPDVMPLRHMYSVPGRPDDIRYFYRKAESVVGYLLETHGTSRFRSYLGHLDEGKSADEALVAVYGFGLDGLDQRWAGALGESEGRDRSGGTPRFAYLGTMLIAVMALVVMATMTTGLVLRRLRSRAEGQDQEHGLTSEEWENRP